jgi:hypothetical protein
MMQAKSLQKVKAAVAVSAILILLGSSMAYATSQKAFHSAYEFQVYDPNEPVVETSVIGNFIDHPNQIHVNISAHDGVKQLKGTYSVVVQIWNDTANS